MNKVKVSQVALLLLIIVPGGKYISLPAILSSQVGRHSWIVVSLLLLFDAVSLAMLLLAVKCNSKKLHFNQVLTRSIGVVGAKLVQFVMFLWLALRLVTLVSSVYNLFNVTFNIKANWLGFIVPLVAVMLFLVSRGFTTIARLNQLFAPLILIAVLSIVLYPIFAVDSANLLPLFGDGTSKVWGATVGNGFWFADFFFIYFVFGEIEVGKRLFSPVLSAFAVGAVLTIVMNGVFVALYGKLAPFTDLAMAKVSQYALNISSSGRLDWLSLSVWTISVFIKMTVLCFSVYHCLLQFLGRVTLQFNYLCATVIIVVLLVPLFVSAEQLLESCLKVLALPIMAVQYILALAMPLLVKVACSKRKPKMLTKDNLHSSGVNS